MNTTTRRDRLEAELRDVRQHVEKLEAELQKVVTEEQHETIDHLEDHFDAVENRFRGLRDFWKTLISESNNKD